MNKTSPAIHVSNQMLGSLAALIILGMLMAFYTVVSKAVQQGEIRRQASAHQAVAVWRCKMLPDLSARTACLLQVHAIAQANLSDAMHASALN